MLTRLTPDWDISTELKRPICTGLHAGIGTAVWFEGTSSGVLSANGGLHEFSGASALKGDTQMTNDQIRQAMLRYFYDRNRLATSRQGKSSGAAASIKYVREDLKKLHGLSAHEVQANLTYLIDQGWVVPEVVQKSFSTPRGGIVPSVTTYYRISAAGIDKIEGPSEFMRDKFHGIHIETTGQSIVSIGDGNRIGAEFYRPGEALRELADAVKSSSELTEATKLDIAMDIESMQAQLAKLHPKRSVLENLWTGIARAASIGGLVDAVGKASPAVTQLIGSLSIDAAA
jgi:hypothetical protein